MMLRRTERARRRAWRPAAARPDPVLLELFNNLFMNVAEQTGAVLQNTSTEREHQGAAGFLLRHLRRRGRSGGERAARAGASGRDGRERAHRAEATARATLKPGDVVALNNPYNGGTHLPDVTVITPVFDDDGKEILFFVGSRGHHADIGGITPGSTPPASRTLEEEGVVIDDFLLVDGGAIPRGGIPRAAGRRELSGAQPRRERRRHQGAGRGQREGRAGTAARGRAYGWATVSAYMRHVMDNAEESVRRVIDRIGGGTFDYTMDNGLPSAGRGQSWIAPPQRGGRFHRHRPAARGQFQLARRR